MCSVFWLVNDDDVTIQYTFCYPRYTFAIKYAYMIQMDQWGSHIWPIIQYCTVYMQPLPNIEVQYRYEWWKLIFVKVSHVHLWHTHNLNTNDSAQYRQDTQTPILISAGSLKHNNKLCPSYITACTTAYKYSMEYTYIDRCIKVLSTLFIQAYL